MIRPILSRLLGSTLLPATLVLASGTSLALAETTTGWALNSYGLPGGVDTPSAEVFPDATVGASVSYSEYGRRTTGVFQILPQLTAALRYSRLEEVIDRRGFLKDRSADVRLQLWSESGWRPAVAVGLQDFIGTGVYSGEYVVATKRIGERLSVSAGLGWGRFAGAARPFPFGDTGGKFNIEDWFSGPVEPFGSISWEVNDRLRLVAEYSADDYSLEVAEGDMPEPDSNLNLGINYRIGDAYQLSAYTVGGNVFGAQVSMALNAKRSPYPSGLEQAPAPVRPRPSPAADPEGWSGAWSADPTAQPAIQTALGDALAKEGQVLEGMSLSADRAEVRIDNRRYIQQAEAVGRTARLMTRALPPSVETFVITSTERGLPVSSVVLRRSDVERLENTEAGEIARAATVTDADPRPAGMVFNEDRWPRFNWGIRPYLSISNFNADDGIPYEVGLSAEASYEVAPGMILSGTIRQKAFGTIEDDEPGELTAPYRVRSDGKMYNDNDHPTLEKLTFAWYAKPTETVYTRLTFGILERMYGGVSAEVLWKPVQSNLALGAEINRVRKRDYDLGFEFQDYEVTTGHVSAYYDFGNGFLAQVDAGRYLAQDWGATLTLSREFANGWRVGAFVTRTDLSEEEFGEGSFDKGVIVSVPVTWAVGQPSTRTVGGTLRSLVRDGGARVRVDGRLYDTIRDSDSARLYQGWGRFWR